MMFRAKTMFDISFSYINLHVDHMGPGFDRLNRKKIMFGAKTRFKICFSYINLHVDHMGLGVDHANR